MTLQVAIGKLELYDFYIFPPKEELNFNHITVFYKEGKRRNINDSRENGGQGEFLISSGPSLTLTPPSKGILLIVHVLWFTLFEIFGANILLYDWIFNINMCDGLIAWPMLFLCPGMLNYLFSTLLFCDEMVLIAAGVLSGPKALHANAETYGFLESDMQLPESKPELVKGEEALSCSGVMGDRISRDS